MEGDYFGPAVNRVARLREMAQPGQILVSRATADVVADHLPVDCRLVEVGSLALRDLARPETGYELEVIDLETRASVTTERPNRIPLPARLASPPFTGFHGRQAERLRL